MSPEIFDESMKMLIRFPRNVRKTARTITFFQETIFLLVF